MIETLYVVSLFVTSFWSYLLLGTIAYILFIAGKYVRRGTQDIMKDLSDRELRTLLLLGKVLLIMLLPFIICQWYQVFYDVYKELPLWIQALDAAIATYWTWVYLKQDNFLKRGKRRVVEKIEQLDNGKLVVVPVKGN